MPNGKLAFPMRLRSCAPLVPWAVRMRPPICEIVGRRVLWLRLVVECLFLMAGLGGQGFGSVSSGPSLVLVDPHGNWYDLYLHHPQHPSHNHSTKDNSAHHRRLPPPAWCLAFHCLLCVVFLPPARQRWRRPPCCTCGCSPYFASFAIVPSYPGRYLTKHRRCTKDRQEFKEYFRRQLETFRQEICNHYITEFGGPQKVYAYSPHSCQFYSTSLQVLLSLNYIPEQVKIPCWHLPHVCAYCHSRPFPSNLWVYIFDHISAEPHR